MLFGVIKPNCPVSCCFFFFSVTATTEIYTLLYTLSLHDALPISHLPPAEETPDVRKAAAELAQARSEEHTSELQSHSNISYAVFCLKKKNDTGLHFTEKLPSVKLGDIEAATRN